MAWFGGMNVAIRLYQLQIVMSFAPFQCTRLLAAKSSSKGLESTFKHTII